MSKTKTKHKSKPKHRNNGGGATSGPPRPARPRPRPASRPSPHPAMPEDTTTRRLMYTAGGAAGTALVGSFLAREGWAPKTIAGLLTAAGGVAAWTSADPMVQNLGAGAMSAAGSQLALLMLDGRDGHDSKDAPAKGRQADANDLPPGALQAAFERARSQLSVAADDARRYAA